MRWFRRKKIPPRPLQLRPENNLAADLNRHLYEECCAAITAQLKPPLQWVMTGEWYAECLKLAVIGSGLNVREPIHILGVPAIVREGSGLPHIESADDAP